jgi:hypothetical protein
MYSVVLMMALIGGADAPATSDARAEPAARYSDHGRNYYRLGVAAATAAGVAAAAGAAVAATAATAAPTGDTTAAATATARLRTAPAMCVYIR